MKRLINRLINVLKILLNYFTVLFFNKNIDSTIKGIKRFLYEISHSQQVKLTLNDNHCIVGNKCDLLVAFSVLFSEGIRKTDTYYIPDSLLSNYTGLLGVDIEKRQYVANEIIKNSNNFKNIKVVIFSKLKNKFENERDINSLAFLEYINSRTAP